MKNKSIIWQSIVIVIGVIVIIALCFFVWKSPEVYSQGMAIVVSAALGAILTAIITRMVIGSQLKSEQEKEKTGSPAEPCVCKLYLSVMLSIVIGTIFVVSIVDGQRL